MNFITARFKIILLCLLMGLFAACGRKIIYEQIPLELCPHPQAPTLPCVQGKLEDEITQRILIERERQVRAYVERLRMSVDCYEKQVKK